MGWGSFFSGWRTSSAPRPSTLRSDSNASRRTAGIESFRAARSERAGKKVPKGVKEAIDRLKRQIASSEEKLAEFDREIDEAGEEFAPIIKRLKEIESEE